MIDELKNPWTILSEKPVYDNKWIAVTEYDVINPTGGHGIYGKIHFKNTAIGIITLNEKLETCLVGQFRFALGEFSWEIPEGGGALGFDPLEAAKRELLEETGLIAHEWTQLTKLTLSNSVCDEAGFIYLARQLEQKQADPEETEELYLKTLHIDEAWQQVREGKMKDSITIIAIQEVKLRLLLGEIK